MNIEQLQRFCAPTLGLLYESPWSAGEYSYASTAFVLVRVPRLADVPEKHHTLPVKKLISDNPMPEEGWVDVPAVALPSSTECPMCKDREPTYCGECYGSGNLTFTSSEHEYECECLGCGGAGVRGGCAGCNNTGRIVPESFVVVGGNQFKASDIHGLQEAFAPVEIAPRQDCRQAAWARFEGGHALIMPMPSIEGN